MNRLIFIIVVLACLCLIVCSLNSCLKGPTESVSPETVPDYNSVITVKLGAGNGSYETGTFDRLISTKLPNYPINKLPVSRINPIDSIQTSTASLHTNTHIGAIGQFNYYVPIKYIVAIDSDNLYCVTHERESIDGISYVSGNYFVYRVFSKLVEGGRELIWLTEDYVLRETPKTTDELIKEHDLKVGSVFDDTVLKRINGRSRGPFNYLCRDGVVCLDVTDLEPVNDENENQEIKTRSTERTILGVRIVKYGKTSSQTDPIITRMKSIDFPSDFS